VNSKNGQHRRSSRVHSATISTIASVPELKLESIRQFLHDRPRRRERAIELPLSRSSRVNAPTLQTNRRSAMSTLLAAIE